jgi:hypothetical protein
MQSSSSTPPSISEIPVFPAARLKAASGGGSWRFGSLVGILAEISEAFPCGAVSFAAEIILEAQRENEPVAWVAAGGSVFFPPDLARRGIDLSALAVIRARGRTESLTAAEWLVRSGAIGLVIVDCDGPWSVSDASLGRIQKLAERARSAVVFLTRKGRHEPSLGSRISLRGCVSRRGVRPFRVDIHAERDKRSNGGSSQLRHYHGPPGMR